MRRVWIVLAASLALGAGECGKSTVTSSDGTLTVKGVLTDEGVECPAMRDESGHLYTLSGSLGGFRQGDRVCVKGKRADISICQQGITINLTSIAPADSCR